MVSNSVNFYGKMLSDANTSEEAETVARMAAQCSASDPRELECLEMVALAALYRSCSIARKRVRDHAGSKSLIERSESRMEAAISLSKML